MNTATKHKIPTTDLLAYLALVYPGAQIGTCNDYGGVADGVSIGTGSKVINLYFDDGSFCHDGWTVEEFDLETLNPEVQPCVNLADALDKFDEAFGNLTGRKEACQLTVHEAEQEVARFEAAGFRGERWHALRDYLARMGAI